MFLNSRKLQAAIRPPLFFFLLVILALSSPLAQASSSSFWVAIAKTHAENTLNKWPAFEKACLSGQSCSALQKQAVSLVARERARLKGQELDTQAVTAVAEFLAHHLPYVNEGYHYVDFDGIEALKRGHGVCWVYALAAFAMLEGIDPTAHIEFRLADLPGKGENHAYTTVWADGVEYDLEQDNPQPVWAAQSYVKDFQVYLAVSNRRAVR